jgi:hypothetical protein
MIFESINSEPTTEGTPCPSSDTLDSQDLGHWISDNRCIFDSLNKEYKCCAESNANIDVITTGGRVQYMCVKECPSYYTYNNSSFQMESQARSNVNYDNGYPCPIDENCPDDKDQVVSSELGRAPICVDRTVKTCYSNITNDNDNSLDNAQWYKMSSNITTSLSCSDYFHEDSWKDYSTINCGGKSNVYDNNKLACCKNESETNYYFDISSKACKLLVCDSYQEVDNTGECKCIQTWVQDTNSPPSENVTTFSKQILSLDSSCVSESNALPGDHQNSCSNDNDKMYCCPGLDEKPYKTKDGDYTCSNVWTSNIKPQGIYGYDSTAVVYHKIDFRLAKLL